MQLFLKAKVIISVCCIVATVLALNAYIQVRSFQNEYLNAQAQRSKALIQGMVEEVSRLGKNISIEDLSGLLGRHCYQLYQLNEKDDIAGISVITRSGILVAHSDLSEPLGIKIGNDLVSAELSTREVITLKDKSIFHTLIPVNVPNTKISAIIDVAWKKISYDKSVHDILIFSLLLFIFSALAASLITALLLNKVFSQLEVVMSELRDSKSFTQGVLEIEKFHNFSLELIASDHPLALVLENIVLGVEQLHPHLVCSILLLDKSGQYLITGAAPSLPTAYNEAINGIKIGAGVGSCGTAAFISQRVLVDDIAAHPYWASFKELAAQFNLCSCWSQPIFSATGQVLGTFAIYYHLVKTPSAEDILLIEKTARLASIAIEKDVAAKALRDSEAMYRLLTEGVEELVWQHDADSRFIYLSPACENLLGYTPDELIGHHFFESLTEEGLEITKRAMGIRQTTLTMPHRRKQGGEIWLEVTVNGEFDETGKMIGLHGIARDATERRKFEAIIKESEQRYRLLVDSSNEGIGVVQDDMLKFMNPALKNLTGYSGPISLELHFLNLIHPDDQELVKSHYQKQLQGDASGEKYQIRLLKNDGHIIWVEISGVKIDWESRPATLNFISDINERKQIQDQVQKFAFFDPLTNLPNRRLLDDRLTQAMAVSKRNNLYCALIFLDLDNFKPLNDSYGHEVGDLLLVEAASRLMRCTREVDTVSRFGGDEFVIILCDLEADKIAATTQAHRVAKKILSTLSDPYLLNVNCVDKPAKIVEHHCTASIGFTVFLDHEGGKDEIIKRADDAMYQAKNDGRNSIRFFDPQQHSHISAVDQGARVLRLNWHESYDCGEPTIDQEHRKLFNFANTLIDSALTRDENPSGFDSALQKLLEYVKLHFADEEAILARNNYVDLESHALAHHNLIEHARQLSDHAKTANVTVGDLVNFLATELIAQHILKTDRRFYSLFKESSSH